MANAAVDEHVAQRATIVGWKNAEEIERNRAAYLEKAHKVRDGLLKTGRALFGLTLAGFALGRIARETFGQSATAVAALAIAAALILLGATLGLQGWNIQTMQGTSLPERMNQWTYKTLSYTGALLAVISGSWAIS